MDEDDYNAIDAADLFGDDEPFSYRQNEDDDPNGRVLHELNSAAFRPTKRPLSLDACDALDWHMRIPCTLEEIEGKRRKVEHDEVILNRLTQRILQARKRHHQAGKDGDSLNLDDSNKEDQPSVLVYPPIDGTPWISASSPDCGRRFYLRLKKSLSVQVASAGRRKKGIFDRPGTSSVEKARASLETDIEATSSLEDSASATCMVGRSQDQLWVDKYAPRSFADLASDDRINRLLLNWMKLWDECVFKKPVRLPESVVSADEMLVLDNGKPRRPKHKIVLISGPAGLGKTTLANVVAQHAGYKIAEVNASDDRNVADFEKRIDDAVGTVRTLGVKTLGSDTRPICLLLDEIDGAPVDSIRLLCKKINKTGRGYIRRPIICICNNLYTPSLRELRGTALVLQMPSSDEERLVKRIEQIAESENVRIDSCAVSTLVSRCGSDLRSCVNGLQYLAARFSSGVINKQNVMEYGDSERQFTERTLFDAWGCVLELRHHYDQRGKVGTLDARCRRVMVVTQRCAGDTNRFFMGLFVNYLNAISGPNGIFCATKTAERFCEFDLLTAFVNRSSNYSFLKYSFAFSVIIHFLVSSSNRVQIVYPTIEQAFTQKRRQCVETLQCVKSSVALSVSTDRMLVLDLLPLLVIIVQPPLKQINAQLYSEREMILCRNIVATMSFYSLTFKPVFVDGTTVFEFYPAIDSIAVFPLEEIDDEDVRQMVPLSKGARQTIAHQIELANLKSSALVEEGIKSDVKEDLMAPRKIKPVPVSLKLPKPSVGLVFHYNHGFSNAIRRNIRMRDLLFEY